MEKLDTRSIQSRFIRYHKDILGYYFYLLAEQVVVVSRDVIFFEKEFLQEGGKGRKIALEKESSNEANQVNQMDADQKSNPTDIITLTPRRSSRVSHPSKRYGLLHDMKKLHIHEEINHDGDPTTYEKALSNKDSLKWLEAMKAEMDSMYANQV